MQPAAAAVPNAAMPTKLSAMCANSHAPRAPGGSTPGAKPMRFAQIVGTAASGAVDEREADVARDELDDEQRRGEHQPGEGERRAQPGERQLADARAYATSPATCASTPAPSSATTPRTGAPTGRANGVAASAAAPR